MKVIGALFPKTTSSLLFGKVAQAYVDHADRMSGIVEGKETAIGFSKRNEFRELFFPFADAQIRM